MIRPCEILFVELDTLGLGKAKMILLELVSFREAYLR